MLCARNRYARINKLDQLKQLAKRVDKLIKEPIKACSLSLLKNTNDTSLHSNDVKNQRDEMKANFAS